MASISGHRGGTPAHLRSGGKILRPRRRTAGARTTPYDRPGSRNSSQQNPNWISRLVYHPSRAIATGAGKLISSVLFSDSSSSSSSDSDSHSDPDGDAEDNFEDSNVDEVTNEGHGALEMINGPMNDQQPVVQKSETKRVIEQLLMQETFLREECDKLTNIIKSRIVDQPTTAGSEDRRGSEFPNSSVRSDVDVPDISSKAVMEAKKWLEEKKLGYSSKSKADYGTSPLDSCMSLHTTEDDVGSPVDMAKSYMRARPPWASPSPRNIEFRSPSPIATRLFKDETPFSYGGSYLSSSKLKRGSYSAGSWNIQEELRRVRAKATEEMLQNLSSPKTVFSVSSLEPNQPLSALVTDILKAGGSDQTHHSAKAVDVSLNLVAGPSSSCQVVQNVQDECQNKALPNGAASISEWSPDMAAEQAVEGTVDGAVKSTDFSRKVGETTQLCSTTGGTTQVILALGATPDSTGNCSTSKQAAAVNRPISNGFPSSEPSLSERADVQPEPRPSNLQNNSENSGCEKQIVESHAEENCELLSETLVDVPVVNESDILLFNNNDSVATGSQNSSSIRQEWLSEDVTHPIPLSGSPRVKKQEMSKLSGTNRRGRGRGRGRGWSKVNTP